MRGNSEEEDTDVEGDGEGAAVVGAGKGNGSCDEDTFKKDGIGNSESKQGLSSENKTAEGAREIAGAALNVCSTESTSPVRSKNILLSLRVEVDEAESNEGILREPVVAGIILDDDDDDDADDDGDDDDDDDEDDDDDGIAL